MVVRDAPGVRHLPRLVVTTSAESLLAIGGEPSSWGISVIAVTGQTFLACLSMRAREGPEGAHVGGSPPTEERLIPAIVTGPAEAFDSAPRIRELIIRIGVDERETPGSVPRGVVAFVAATPVRGVAAAEPAGQGPEDRAAEDVRAGAAVTAGALARNPAGSRS